MSKLDIGCGYKKPAGYLGCDISYYEYPKGEFKLCDINEPLPYRDAAFSECRAYHVLEHIRNDRKVQFMNEVCRILEVGGKFIFELPPAVSSTGGTNLIFFTDPTHTAWWMPGTFVCFYQSFRESDPNHKKTYEDGYGIKTTFEPIRDFWLDEYNWHCELRKY